MAEITMPRFPTPLPSGYVLLDALYDDPSVSICLVCSLAEPIDGEPYRICGECGHVYQTKADFVREYLRVSYGPREPMWGDDPFFCPVCGHDF